METKICSKCGVTYESTKENFYADKSHKDGLANCCKFCESKSKKENYASNKTKNNARSKRYYETHKEYALELSRQWKLAHPERAKELNVKSRNKTRETRLKKQSLYREKHREELRKKSNQYYYQNKEQCTISVNRWQKENRPVCCIATRKYRSKMLGLESTLTKQEWKTIVSIFDNKCAYCGKTKPLVREHVVPVSGGGSFTKDNIIPSCKSCNSSKNNRSFSEWYPKFRYYSEDREKNILEFLGKNKPPTG
jgi:hypothetical protein